MDLKWFGHVGHFIGGKECRFRMFTLVNDKYVVSTVGDYFPLAMASKEPSEIGLRRLFETMVFKFDGTFMVCGCPNWTGTELDMEGYNDAKSAQKGHMGMCEDYKNP